MSSQPLPIAQQWTLKSMQVVNWGCFDGYHPVEFAGAKQVTLITGATGSGKSTLLDAHIVLMHDPKTALNRASNSSRHRSRSTETRNVVSYVRGVTGQTRDIDGERDVMLREGTVWSAISETWKSSDGATFTALCAFFCSPTDTTRPSVRRDAWIAGDFDLRWLEPFATGIHLDAPLPPRAMEKAVGGLNVVSSTAALHRLVWRRLGIGNQGDGLNAMALLYKVQSADAVDSVNDLFTKFVLDEPGTYDAAEKAISHFNELKDSFTKVHTILDQTQRLARIPEQWAKYTTGREELEFFNALQPTPAPADTPFWKWRRDREYTALDTAEELATRNHRAADQEARAARVAVDQLETEWRQITSAIAENKTLTILELLEQTIEEADRTRERAEEERDKLQSVVGTALTVPTTRAGYDKQRGQSNTVVAAFSHAKQQADEKHRQAQQAHWQLSEERRQLLQQQNHFSGRHDVTDPTHDAIRNQYATLTGLPTTALPFVGELIDMQLEHEVWRLGAEKALGGFARTLLVPANALDRFRLVADAERTNRRIRYLIVTKTDLPLEESDPATIAGRLQYRDHPYAGWLSRRIPDIAGHLCVSSPEELNHLPAKYNSAVTIHGQTATRDGGQVGGQVGHQHTIGFSPQNVLASISAQIEALELRLHPAKEVEEKARANANALVDQHAAHDAFLATRWEHIDVEGVESRLRGLLDRKTALAKDQDAEALVAQRDRLKVSLSDARDHVATSKNTAEQLDTVRSNLATRKDNAWTHFSRLDQLPDPDMGRLDTMLSEYRDGPGERGPAQESDFAEPFWSRFVRHLNDRFKSAESGRRDALDRLTQTFEDYLRVYDNPDLHTDPDRYYPEFRAILDNHLMSGVDEAKAEFIDYADNFGGVELQKLSMSYQTERDSIGARLAEINNALRGQAYGPTPTGSIKIVPRDGHAPDEVARFRAELHQAISGTTTVLSYNDAVAKFDTYNQVISRIADPKRRDILLDVRRHILLEAQHLDNEHLVAFYRDLGAKSGGETQELTMFIIAAAIRYRIGSLDSTTPTFAPVFMDEGLIKADPDRTRRAVHVWTHLGFQPIIATTADKHESVSHTATVLLAISKDPNNRSRIDMARALTPPVPEES